MKKLALVLSILMLLSSCYGYRRANRDFDSFEKGDRIKLMLNHKTRKGKFIAAQNDTLILERASGKIEKISTTEIIGIKRGKFSWVKSVVLPGVAVGTMFYAAITFHDFNIDVNLGH